MVRHILVPSDHSDLSLQAAGEAVRLADSLGARITFFQAIHPPTVLNYVAQATPDFDRNPSLMSTEEIRTRMMELAEAHLGSLVRQAEQQSVEADLDVAVSDQPHLAIVEAAARKGCDLILMASHGRSGVEALLLGSVTQKVLTHGHLPVLVWRGSE